MTTIIDFKDYAPYYIGCRCFNTWFPEGDKPREYNWILAGFRADNEKHYLLENDSHFTWTDSIKPILRKLDDITDEEIKELIGWHKLNETYADVSFERCNSGIIINYSIDAGDEGVYKQSHNITYHVFSPKEWKYLLSKGFDLFFLIKNGVAIDSKTLK